MTLTDLLFLLELCSQQNTSQVRGCGQHGSWDKLASQSPMARFCFTLLGSNSVAGLRAKGNSEWMQSPFSWSVWTATPSCQLRPEEADNTAGAQSWLRTLNSSPLVDRQTVQGEDDPTARSRG